MLLDRGFQPSPTERLCSSISGQGPFRQQPQPISQKNSSNTRPIRCQIMNPPPAAWPSISTTRARASRPAGTWSSTLAYKGHLEAKSWGGKRTKGRRQGNVLQDQTEYPPLSSRRPQHNSVKEASLFFSHGPATVFESDIIRECGDLG